MRRQTLSKIDGQLRMDAAPVLPSTCPLFRNIHHRQIQHFQQTIVCRENALGFCDLPQLPIKAFDRVRGIDRRRTSLLCQCRISTFQQLCSHEFFRNMKFNRVDCSCTINNFAHCLLGDTNFFCQINLLFIFQFSLNVICNYHIYMEITYWTTAFFFCRRPAGD